jgi:tetratricopeptide (TPR) repeat protein
LHFGALAQFRHERASRQIERRRLAGSKLQVERVADLRSLRVDKAELADTGIRRKRHHVQPHRLQFGHADHAENRIQGPPGCARNGNAREAKHVIENLRRSIALADDSGSDRDRRLHFNALAGHFNLGETSHAAENVQKAYQLCASLSEREKLGIELIYDALVTGDFEAALKSDLACTHIYPRDSRVLTNLADFYTYFGEYEKSLAAVQEALKFNPGTAQNYSDLVIHYLHVNRLDEAKAAALEAKSHNVDSPAIHASLYLVEFLQHDATGMEQEAAEVMGKPGSEDLVLYYESDTAAYGGHFVQARHLSRRAADSALRAGQKETMAGYEAEAAVREALVGNLALAKRQAKDALAFSSGRDVVAMSAIALELAGDSADSNRLADDLSKRFLRDMVVRYNSLPAIRAATALRNGDSGKAIAALAASAPYELGQTAQKVTFVLYPIYLRGEAYLAARQGTAAAAEFQKILDHPGLVQNEPIGALAHLQIGCAYAVQNDTAKSRAAYQDFFALWKDADSDIPILKQAGRSTRSCSSQLTLSGDNFIKGNDWGADSGWITGQPEVIPRQKSASRKFHQISTDKRACGYRVC